MACFILSVTEKLLDMKAFALSAATPPHLISTQGKVYLAVYVTLVCQSLRRVSVWYVVNYCCVCAVALVRNTMCLCVCVFHKQTVLLVSLLKKKKKGNICGAH